MNIDNINTELTKNTFNLISALAYMIFWIIFSFTTLLLNCEMGRIIKNNIYIQHGIGILGFFFLMAITDPKNSASVSFVWLKSLCGYLIFMLFIKSDVYIAVLILLLLGIDQTIAYHISYLKQIELNKLDNIDHIKTIEKYEFIRDILMYSMGVLLIVGVSIYAKHAYDDHNTDKETFSLFKFIIGTNTCKEK